MMTTDTKLADLPAKWRGIALEAYRAWDSDQDSRVGKLLRAMADPEFARSYRADIAELHAALSQQPSAAGVPEVPFETVRRVVRALTMLGVAVPESQEEQYARAIELIELLCHEAAPEQRAAPAYPMGNDREVLLYLMQQFDVETWVCPECGHTEDTATTDSADYLRRYLSKHPEQRSAGDARAQFEAWAAGRGWKLSPYQNNCGIVVWEKYGHPGVQRCWEAWQAALAARQPVGGAITGWRMIDGVTVFDVASHSGLVDPQQFVRYDEFLAARHPVGLEPVAWMDPDGSRVITKKAKMNASSAYQAATYGYTVPLYAAPPAAHADDDWHLRGYAYASKQATTCAGCGEHKHTPLRIDAMGVYVCLTCIDNKLSSLLGEFGYTAAQADDWHARAVSAEKLSVPHGYKLVRDSETPPAAQAYTIKTESGELPCSLAVSVEWEKSEEYIARLEAAQAVDLDALRKEVKALKKNPREGDEVFRCGYNGALDVVIALIDQQAKGVDRG